MNALSGKSRALFMTRFDSFAEWEKDNKLVDSNPTLAAGLERAGLADGELLNEVDQLVFTYDEDLSYHPHAESIAFTRSVCSTFARANRRNGATW